MAALQQKGWFSICVPDPIMLVWDQMGITMEQLQYIMSIAVNDAIGESASL